MSDVDLDKLTLENMDAQFCSDWLKDQIRALIQERDGLKKQIGNSRIYALDLEKQRAELERLAESWMKSYDELKEKYEPTELIHG